LGLGCVAALAILLFVQFQRNDAAEGAAAECKADLYEAQVKDLQAKLAVSQKVAAYNKAHADATEAKLRVREKDYALLKEAVADGGGDIPPAIRDRLRKLR
jgi:hypothetical protein